MDESLLSWYQALQLLALGPCLFMVFFLGVTGRRKAQVLVPLLYFLSLSCGFLLPLHELLGLQHFDTLLAAVASAEPVLSFLFIVQFMTGKPPSPVYWAVLAVPFIGGSPFLYAASVTDAELCVYERLCAAATTLSKLYDIFSISFVCLLTLIIYRRIYKARSLTPPTQTHQKFALVLALVILNLALLGVDMMQLLGYSDIGHARLAKTIVHIGFIYLVLTSVFRVFDRPVEIDYRRVPSIQPSGPSERDLALKARIDEAFSRDRLYRDMELSREKLAKALAVNETTLSRVVNQCFHENVSMLINQYRVEEAKARLAAEVTPVTVIAFEVGFSSIPSFNRVFRQFCEMSPSEWRQRNAVAGG